MGHFSVKILAQEGQFSVTLNVQENDLEYLQEPMPIMAPRETCQAIAVSE
jgi:hypothetical protein